MPEAPAARVEVRRLASWFNDKFHAEVSGPLVTERVFKRHMTRGAGRRPARHRRDARRAPQYPLSSGLYRLAGADARLARRRRLSYADLAAAAICRSADYLGDVPWNEDEAAKNWYARVKSRPSFRPLLADTLAGLPPAKTLRQSRLLTDPAAIKAALIEQARAQGFDVAGVARARRRRRKRKPRLERFLADGAHGDMAWMETTRERRGDPRALWPEVRSVVMLGLNYGPGRRPARHPQATRPRRDLGLCPRRGLSRDHQAATEGDRALARGKMPAATSRSSSIPRR